MRSGCRVSVLQDEEFCGWTVKMAAQQYECPRCHGIICLKMVKMVNFVLGVCPHSEKKIQPASPCNF